MTYFYIILKAKGTNQHKTAPGSKIFRFVVLIQVAVIALMTLSAWIIFMKMPFLELQLKMSSINFLLPKKNSI